MQTEKKSPWRCAVLGGALPQLVPLDERLELFGLKAPIIGVNVWSLIWVQCFYVPLVTASLAVWCASSWVWCASLCVSVCVVRRVARALSRGSVRVSPCSCSEWSFSWLIVIVEKGHEIHLYVFSPEANKQTRIKNYHSDKWQVNRRYLSLKLLLVQITLRICRMGTLTCE